MRSRVSAALWLSRSVGQRPVSSGPVGGAWKAASWAQKNGRSGWPQASRQPWIKARNWAPYAAASSGVLAFDSPWYHSTPATGWAVSGATIWFQSSIGTWFFCASASRRTTAGLKCQPAPASDRRRPSGHSR